MRLTQASKDRKRANDRIGEAMSILRSVTLREMEDMSSESSCDIIALLCAKFGGKPLLVLGQLLSKLPSVISQQIEDKVLSASVGELGKSLTKEELAVMKSLLSRCEDFLQFSLDESLTEISRCASIPLRRILYPPTTTCFHCGWSLSQQNRPAKVTVFEHSQPIPGLKFTLKCCNCKVNYGYSMFGDTDKGYKFYDKRRPYVESSNVSYLARELCLQQIHLA